jgi:hypothetical protein
MNIESVIGKVFHANNDEEYGVIRSLSDNLPAELINTSEVTPIAEDACGNYFVLRNEQILFWEHETSDTVLLADNISDFLTRCDEPIEIELKEGQLTSIWIDPEFAKEFGVEKP